MRVWRDGRPEVSIYAPNLNFLNAVTTPTPSQHPWLEWRERTRIQHEFLVQRQLNANLNLQLIEALQGLLRAQNQGITYLGRMEAMAFQLQQTNANEMLMRHQLRMSCINNEQRAEVIRAALMSIRQIIERVLDNYL